MSSEYKLKLRHKASVDALRVPTGDGFEIKYCFLMVCRKEQREQEFKVVKYSHTEQYKNDENLMIFEGL